MPAPRSRTDRTGWTTVRAVGRFYCVMRTFFCALAAIFVLFGLTACNTMRGVGEDISAFGRYLSSSSGTSSPHTPPPPSSF